MTRPILFRSCRRGTLDAPAPPLGRGATAVLLTGAAVLAVSAIAGRLFWADPTSEGAQPALAGDTPPRIEPFVPQGGEARGLAALSGAEDLPLAALRSQPAPQPAEPAAPDAVSIALLGDEVPLPRPARAALQRPAAEPDTGPAAPVRPEPSAPLAVAVIAGLPPVAPPPRPATPEARGTSDDPAPIELAALSLPDATPDRAGGLARSLLPRARPAAIARLASADTATATRASADIGATAQTPTRPFAVPAVSGDDTCPTNLARAIPRRPSGANGGARAVARLASASGGGRDGAIAQAVIAGNLPDFQRRLVPVTLEGDGADGRPARITLCVMPDYLALGSDDDFVRVPLGLNAATRIAERFDMVLPTTRMVDAIHAQAGIRLRPQPMPPGAQMASTDYFLRHNATLEGQRRNAGAPLGALISGHKKDLVLTNRLARNPGRVAIYGWHQANGQPIQPLSTVHGAGYADYSHGIRLVSRTAFVNGRAADLRDLLDDRRYAGLLSDEGPIAAQVMLAALR
ncbi:MAG: hypothetical protein HLUCCA12_00545 [Rhodobacteraceae bacterium HLUCCA12]|nr:MAG: hypothetical protein HLUCCA12_00545 [Rhodobacteraceae bacterium HLUCCA12]